jgi:hypothetical protein
MRSMSWKAVLAFLVMAPLAACAGREDRAPAAPDEATGERRGFFARMLGDGDIPNAGPCPLMGVLYESSRVVEFTTPEERFANVAWTGEMRGVRGLCRYTAGEPIVMNLEVDMAFGRGPAAEGQSHTFRYWVAVTRKDQAPIAKEYFEVKVDFPTGADRLRAREELERIVIPRAAETVSGANFEVLVGFELTPEQLAFNRAGKRFRVDAGS